MSEGFKGSLADALAQAELFVDGDWVESKDQDPEGDVRLIQLADIGDGEYIDKSARLLTSAKAHQLRCTFLKPGDVLVARMPDPLGRACIFPGDSKSSVTVVDVCIIRPHAKHQDSRWLMHYLNSPVIRNQIAGFTTGTTRSRISRGNLAKVKVVVPPLAEQRRIANVLDRAEALRAKRRAALAQLDTLTQSIFLDLFGDAAKNDRNWPTQRMEELMKIRRGGSPRPIENYLGGEINWIKIGDGTQGSDIYLERSVNKITKEGLKKTVFLRAGSLIFANCGVSLGFARILKIDGCIHDGWLSFEDIPEDKLDKLFLLKALNSITNHFRQIAPAGTQPNLNTALMKNFRIILPPITLQREFARRLAEVEKLKTAHRASLAELDSLFGSLQHRAFRGEL